MNAGISRDKSKIVIIAGPTGSGKSTLSQLLFEHEYRLPLEIINADSRQIYRGMDIGTDKPSPEIIARIPHHLLNILDPDTPFSAADYQRQACTCIEDISSRGSHPLIVGGTGLYIRALRYGLAHVPPGDPEIRGELRLKLAQMGTGELYHTLQRLDPDRAKNIQPNDTYRLLRALEILLAGNKTITEEYLEHAFQYQQFDSLYLVLNVDRHQLYNRIEQRVDGMIKAGLTDETKRLVEQFGYAAPAFNAIGYKQIIMYLKHEISLERAIEIIKRDTRHYAKRQFTWFRKESDVHWLDHNPDQPQITQRLAFKKIREFLN